MDRHAGPTTDVLVWAALVTLTLTSWALAHAGLGAAAMPVALVIASGKSALVLAFFMHLRHSTASIRLVVLVTLLLIAIFVVLTGLDVGSRDGTVRVP